MMNEINAAFVFLRDLGLALDSIFIILLLLIIALWLYRRNKTITNIEKNLMAGLQGLIVTIDNISKKITKFLEVDCPECREQHIKQALQNTIHKNVELERIACLEDNIKDVKAQLLRK
jgi:hypothetical protein